MADPTGILATTERLTVRQWREDDAEPFFTGTNTPAVMRWLGGVMDVTGQAALIARVLECQRRNGFCFWIVERSTDGAILGFCGLKRADAPGSSVTGEMEIGWRLREDAWGQGYALEAASAALHLAFACFGAAQVVALTVSGNGASWGLMERLGMQRRPALDYEDSRYGADLSPTIVYALTKDQWERAR